MGLAQRIYAVGLDSLLRDDDALVAEAVCLRAYEMAGEAPRAFFDISEGDQARLLQMSAANSHLEALAHALSVALTIPRQDEMSELRLFRIPALNFEALWFKGDTDVLVPLRAVGKLAPYQALPLAEALPMLREAARPLLNMDDTMGAYASLPAD